MVQYLQQKGKNASYVAPFVVMLLPSVLGGVMNRNQTPKDETPNQYCTVLRVLSTVTPIQYPGTTFSTTALITSTPGVLLAS